MTIVQVVRLCQTAGQLITYPWGNPSLFWVFHFGYFTKSRFDHTVSASEPPAFLRTLIFEPQHNHAAPKKTGKRHQL